jgi:hypothetical protein
MNRLSALILIGLAGLMASCGSSVSSSTKPATNDVYSMVVTPVLFTLNSGDWTSITATVDVSYENGAAKPVSPQPTIKFYSSDSRVSVSPNGQVCAGEWDTRYLTCTPTSTLPTGYVTISAYNASNNVTGSTLLAVHPRATSITLNGNATSSNPAWPGSSEPWPSNASAKPLSCVSQNGQVKYVAQPLDANGNPIPNCSIVPEAAGCINDNDYTWTTDNSNVATVSTYGFVQARNPGVTNVFASLNGTTSAPLAFVTCPPSSIVLTTSSYTNGTPIPPYSTADLDSLSVGSALYVTATLLDTNGNLLITSPLNYTTSNPLTGAFSTDLALTSKLTANTSGRFSMVASCVSTNCNPAVQDFVSPAGAGTSLTTGFGFPIYSNVIGATVLGQAGSTVLVSGQYYADGVTPSHRLEAYDSESLALTHTVALANVPNSLVVAPNGAVAYLGSSAGLMVANLTSFESSVMSYPVQGGLATDVVTGSVLGVSHDSRYVLISDVTNGLVFFIDTTGTKVAVRYTIPNITSVTFADDDSNFWIGGANGVYVYQADTFVPISSQTPADLGLSTKVNALAWMPDGQSYFASGDQASSTPLYNYSTCNGQNAQSPTTSLPTSVTGGLFTTALQGATASQGVVPYLIGLNGSQWFDYSVTSTAQVPVQTVTPPSNTPLASYLTLGGTGNTCKSTVTINTPSTATDSLPCTATQVTFSPKLEQAFVTGVDPSCTSTDTVIHGYDLASHTVISSPSITTAAPVIPLSGGVLNDGRKLYFGTWAGLTAQTATLHRIDLSTGTGTPGTLTEDLSTPVDIVPSFVAVVPK